MTTPEGRVKGWLDKMFKAEGVCYFAPQAGPYGSSGVEDRIAIVCGLYLGVEVKADASKKMTAKQELRKKAVLEAGGAHFLVYDKETIEQVRQFIVRTRGSRQKDAGVSIGEPRSNTVRYTKSKASERLLSSSSSWARGNKGTTELRVFDPAADPVLLQLAGSLQADGPPTNHGSFSN